MPSRIWPWVKPEGQFHLALAWLLFPCLWKRAVLVASGERPGPAGRAEGFIGEVQAPRATPPYISTCARPFLSPPSSPAVNGALSVGGDCWERFSPLALVTAHKNMQGICHGSPSRSCRTRESSLCSPSCSGTSDLHVWDGAGVCGAARVLPWGWRHRARPWAKRSPLSYPSVGQAVLGAARTQQKDGQSLMPHSAPRASRALALCCLS